MEEPLQWYEIAIITFVLLIVLCMVLLAVGSFVISIINNAFGFVEIVYITIMGRPMAKHFVLFKKKLKPGEDQILHNHFRLYRSLPESEKRVFEHRVVRFMNRKEFVPQSGIDLDRHKKIIISAIAIKLTFGLRRYSMPILKRILVFPGPFKNRRTGRIHKGEFNLGLHHIAFSWKDLMEGIDDPRDNLHLGLHEFTHALMMELHKGHWADSYFQYQFNRIDRMIRHPKSFHRISSNPYLRKYAQTNKMEFFAVAVEHFFETPDDFQRQMPELYKAFTKLLNIDPLEFKWH